MRSRFAFDREKFKRLVHYVIWRAGERDGFGAVKLNKVLWFSDARAHMLRGEPITDHTASSASEESHDYAEIAEMGEELPYHAIFSTRMRQPDNTEKEWAQRRAKELGLP